MASASPRRGATSTAPEIGMTSIAMPRSREEPASDVGVGRGDSDAGQVLEGLVRRVCGGRGGEPAAAVAEVADAGQFGAGLGEQVDARDADVGNAVADEFDDVVRPHEQDVEVEVLDARDQAAVVLLEDEARVMKQGERRLDQAPLVGDGQSEAVVRRTRSRVHRVARALIARPSAGAVSCSIRSSIAR